jgi:siroheme decarboxylase
MSPGPTSMDQQDRKLLNEIQAGFPVEPHPYRVLGKRLNMDEKEALARVVRLRKAGIIRRLGASIDSRRVGYVSTLLAAKAQREKFESVVKIINACPGVTHNYERRHEYNVWFTLIAPSVEEKERIIRRLREETGIEILELPAKKIFKIRVDFRF